MSGHSFGGVTAISVANIDERVKACATLDPWLYVYHKEMLDHQVKLNIPFFSLSTEAFHPACPFPGWESLKRLFKSCNDKRIENVVMKKTGHLH